MTARFAILGLAFAASNAAAEPTTALPGEESGRVDHLDDGDSTIRIVGRGMLFVPKLAVRAVLSPVEGTVWALDRYQLIDRAHRLMWNDAETIGLVPTLDVDSSFGFELGAHFIDRDVLGEGERIDLRASGGGRYRQRYELALHSGNRLGDVISVESRFQYQRRPKEEFFGIGNLDGSESRFRHDLLRSSSVVDARLVGELHARLSGAVTDHAFGASDQGPSIDTLYMTDRIVGFDGYRTGYSELELRWDTRGVSDASELAANPSTGGLVSAYAGRIHGLQNSPDFWRYGADLQRFVRVAEGPRVLWFRAHAEGVTGSLEELPFDELPRLGGRDQLRGYAADRFRDRFSVAGSIDYRWDLAREYSASLFVDAGRVYHAPGDFGFDKIRVGYGISLEAVSEKSFLGRVSVASSIDGGVFVDLTVDPAFKIKERVQRR